MAFAQAQRRPIPGAVATLGVSERVAFLRRTYALLGVALVAFAVLTAAMFHTQASLDFVIWQARQQSAMPLLIVFIAFIGCGVVSRRLANSDTSRGLQYLGLALSVVVYSVMTQPLIWYAYAKLAKDGSPDGARMVISQAALITAAIFVGLTATVFISKKDFSFLRGILVLSTFGFLGILLTSMFFHVSVGGEQLLDAVGVILLSGYILYQTSAIMKSFQPTRHVAAALMLFSTVATLFWYVLDLLNSRRS